MVDDTPLAPDRLVAIWRSLDEKERFPFFLSLREDLADRLIELTCERKEDRR